ncbi:MAG TPA: hypothetical protein VFL13_06280 [Candidatus Baltobacteraceae bacterium]|nr:hypothetical protein [Candidatus Baltobacteraceae bacterium]
MLEILRVLTLGATAGIVFAAVLTSLPVRAASRLVLAGAIGAWIALAVTIAGSGLLTTARLALPVLFMLPLIAAGLAAASAGSRRAIMSIPVQLIAGLNAMRVLGVFMLIAGITGQMSGPFPYAAGIGDIITGIFAIPVARLAARDPRDIRVLEWNVFGALDLVAAVSLGILTANGWPLHQLHAGPGSAAMTTLPWALIPVVLVPTYLIGHAVIFAHLRASATDSRKTQTVYANA